MPFPLSVVGSFKIPRRSPVGDVRDQVITAASVALAGMRVHVRRQDGRVLGYRDAYDWWGFQRTNRGGHPLAAFNKVSLIVGGCDGCAKVDYRLSTATMLTFVSCATLPFAVIGFVAGDPRGELTDHLLVGAFTGGGMWAWIFGANYLLARLRGPGWLRERLAEQVARIGEAGVGSAPTDLAGGS